MSQEPVRPLHFAAFVMNTTSHIVQGTWRRPSSRSADFNDLDHWVNLAKTLERGKFDAIFFADVVGLYAPYRGDERKYFEAGLQVPSNDPSVLASAIAYATEHLGIAFTASILQEHPFNFARRMLQDRERGIHAEYDKVHRINHIGERYQVEGPHLVSPSPQRTPFLFQAGASEAGRDFAAQNAEAVFLGTPNREAALRDTSDIRRRAVALGRRADDLKFFQGLYVVPTSTEAEAARVAAELDEWIDHDGHLAHMSGSIGIDFGHDDLDTPVGEIKTEGVRSMIGWINDLVTDRPATLRDVAHHTATNLRIVGTPEKIADELAAWQQSGVDGINLMNYEIPTSYEDFADQVIPTLRKRGLIQSEYSDGTLRQKIFGEGDRLPDRHHATRYRGAFGAGVIGAPDETLAGAVN